MADRDPARASGGDEFEARNMRGGAPLVHRDKKVARGMALGLLAPTLLTWFLAIYIPMANATASKPVPPAALPFVSAGLFALGLMFVLIGLVFSVVRTVVTAHEVNIKYGLWGPNIPLQSIRSCRVVDYDWTEFGGWGMRMGKGGAWAYVPSGGRVVELLYAAGEREKRVLVSVENPDEMVRQVVRAKARPVDQGGRLRVKAPADAAVVEQRDDEDGKERRSDRAR